jgi:Cu+-exporting ATPase
MFVAIDGALAGLIAVADPVKASTPEAIPPAEGRRPPDRDATGDNEITARAVASTLGIADVIAG